MHQALEPLLQYAHTLTDLRHTLDLLQWDQETYLPPKAHDERGEQCATLSQIIHAHASSDQIRQLLSDAYVHLHHHPDSSDFEKGLVRVMQRDYDLSVKLPSEFVHRFSATTSKALSVWVEAKKQKDFSLFAPTLAKIVDLCRQKVEYFGYQDSPYDALLDQYEEGLTTQEVTRIFSELKQKLVPLIPTIQSNWSAPLEIIKDIPDSLQQQIAEEALTWIAYDFDRGRQDTTAHPFTTTLGHHDRRVTNRYHPRDLSSIFSALHEGGHGLYEQGISEKLVRTPLDTGASLGIHESQSRLWENLVGRSKAFWQKHFPRLQELIGDYLNVSDFESWYRAINQVRPSLIRVEADEVTYCLHIIIRFELEKELIEGHLSVADLPSAWNEKYHSYLGVDVPDDSVGVLQDIHWSYGNHGYFPTYALGTIASAQIFYTYLQSQSDGAEQINQGNYEQLHHWLRKQIYQYGATYTSTELLRKVTSDTYNPGAFIDYLKQKFL